MFFRRLRTLVWRFWLFKFRHPVLTLAEFSFPILAIGFFMILYSFLSSQQLETTTISAKSAANLEIYSHKEQDVEQGIQIIYAPNNSFTRQLMNNLPHISKSVNITDCDDELCIYDVFDQNSDTTFVGIKFHIDRNQLIPPFKFNYTLIVDGETFDKKFNSDLHYLEDRSNPHWSTYFIYVQSRVNLGYLNLLSCQLSQCTQLKDNFLPSFDLKMKQLQTRKGGVHTATRLKNFATRLVGYSLTSFCPALLFLICTDKKYGAREMMKLAGISDFTYYLSLFLNYVLICSVPTLIATIVLFVNPSSQKFEHSSALVVYASLLLYVSSFVLFCMACSAPFTNYIQASILTIALHVMLMELLIVIIDAPGYYDPSALENYMQQSIVLPEVGHLILCIFPSFTLEWLFTYVAESEALSDGTHFSDMFEKIVYFDVITLGSLWIIMLGSCVIACLCLWYFERIWPLEGHTPKPYYFPLQPSYWMESRQSISSIPVSGNFSRFNSGPFESEENLEHVLVVSRLYKKLPGFFSRKIVIDDLSFSVYSSEITVLLGVHGAGKTTLARIIAGIVDYSKGTILVDGNDVGYERKQAQRLVGFVPSKVMFDVLTIAEYLYLYGRLKGLKSKALKKQITELLVMLDLGDKTRTRVDGLSFNIQRKFCLALAMLGSPKLLVLDEPTKGLDMEARQWFWDILLKLKEKMALLVTTHNLQEAQTLGDRIAIISEGRGQCFGSQKFLRDRFGVGYHIKFKKADNIHVDEVLKLLEENVGDAQKAVDTDAEVGLTVDSDNVSKFPIFFKKVEEQHSNIGKVSITVTSLHDVYGQKRTCTYASEERSHVHLKKNALQLATTSRRGKGLLLVWQQFCALCSKHFIQNKRSATRLVVKIFLPAVYVSLMAMLQYLLVPSNEAYTFVDLKQLSESKKAFVQTMNYSSLNENFEAIANLYLKGDKIKLDNLTSTACNPLTHSDCLHTYAFGATFHLEINTSWPTVVVWHDPAEPYNMPISVQMVFQAAQRRLLHQRHKEKLFKMTVVKVPYRSIKFYRNYVEKANTVRYIYLFILPIFIAFVSSRNVLLPIYERSVKVKLTLLIAGVRPFLLWFVFFIFDMMTQITLSVVLVLFLMKLDIGEYLQRAGDELIAVFVFSSLFGFAVFPMHYALSNGFNRIRTAYFVTAISSLLVTVATGMLTDKLYSLAQRGHSVYIFVIPTYLLRMLPMTCLIWAWKKMFVEGAFSYLCQTIPELSLRRWCYSDWWKPQLGPELSSCCYQLEVENPYSMITWLDRSITQELVLFVIQAFCFWMLLMLIESRVLQKIKCSRSKRIEWKPTEHDLVREAAYVKQVCNSAKPEEGVVISNLTKTFGKVTAVDTVSLAVKNDEIFAILGMEGAGKTTLLQMLATDITPSAGDVFIDGVSLQNNEAKYRECIGYCPKCDSLLERLTGREMLRFIGTVKGLDEDVVVKQKNLLLDMLDLMDVAGTQIITYNRSSRRKLAVALALVGFPKVVLLDEPMAGVDFEARRRIQDTLLAVKGLTKCTMILTSDTINECELLCNRMTIMVNGRLQCVGSAEHLLRKFGQGYTVIVKLSPEELSEKGHKQRASSCMSKVFPSATLKYKHKTRLYYHLPDNYIPWSKLFSNMEQMKNTENNIILEEYWISNVTLEHIFLCFNGEERSI